MRLTTSLIITAVCSIIGTIWVKQYLLLPYSGLVASAVDLLTRKWVSSNRLGRAVRISMILKFTLSIIGFYAILAQFACVGLLVYWIAT